MTQQRYMRPGLDFAVGKAVEELGELQAALGKTLRWGWDSYNPELPENERETNAAWVLREISDVRGALDNLERELPAVLKAREDGRRGIGERAYACVGQKELDALRALVEKGCRK